MPRTDATRTLTPDTWTAMFRATDASGSDGEPYRVYRLVVDESSPASIIYRTSAATDDDGPAADDTEGVPLGIGSSVQLYSANSAGTPTGRVLWVRSTGAAIIGGGVESA